MGCRERSKRFNAMLGYDLKIGIIQSCEDLNYRDTAAFQMKEQIEYAILTLLEKKLCGDSKVWGNWKDPQLDSHIVSISDMFV